ncbi:hypothetical protein [Luteibacter sp. PvP019]|uniref:hypothetical protein n=1 Tax=Luteibacter sp. PvP019 TaxID=3156436 RepID=UPI003397DC42
MDFLALVVIAHGDSCVDFCKENTSLARPARKALYDFLGVSTGELHRAKLDECRAKGLRWLITVVRARFSPRENPVWSEVLNDEPQIALKAILRVSPACTECTKDFNGSHKRLSAANDGRAATLIINTAIRMRNRS